MDIVRTYQGEFYMARYQVYNLHLARYTERTEAFALNISYIQETMTAQNAVMIQKPEAHSYNLLKALKKRLAPTDSTRPLPLEKRSEKI